MKRILNHSILLISFQSLHLCMINTQLGICFAFVRCSKQSITVKIKSCACETHAPYCAALKPVFFYIWPYRMTLTFSSQNVKLHVMHMNAKYWVAIFNIAKALTKVKVLGHTNTMTDSHIHWQTGQNKNTPDYSIRGQKNTSGMSLPKFVLLPKCSYPIFVRNHIFYYQ